MEFQKLTAEVRIGRKKGTARRLRRDGRIPAVCYGPEQGKPLALSVDPKALTDALRGPMGRNTVLQLEVAGDGAPSAPLLVMLQDAQFHPVERDLLHADFLTVSRDREVRVEIPLALEGRAVGVQAGGVLSQVFRAVPVRCRLDNIPSRLTLDVSDLELGSMLKVADLELPEGVAVEFDLTQTLVSVAAPSKAAEAAEAAEEGEAAPAEGEEGAKAEGKEAAKGEGSEGKKEGD